jgi:hypothetical protein
MNKITDPSGREPILELLEPRLLLDGAPAAQAIELSSANTAVFVENQGQWSDESVRYALDVNGANVLLTDTGPVFQLSRRQPDNDIEQTTRFSAHFDGANSISPIGIEQTQGVFNYHIGDRSTWRDGVSTFATVAYLGLYDGIDLHTKGRRDHLKYEFHVDPGADFSLISISYSGIDSLSIDPSGALHVRLSGDWGEVVDDTPYIYQIIDDVQVEVAGAYRLADRDTYAFEITGPYDASRELIIDPELDWSTYLGGNSGDRAYDIAIDSDGGSLVTGYTWSRGFISDGWDTSIGGGGDAFVMKLNSAGEHIWSTYMGGKSSDYGYGIAVDADGNSLVTGRTQSGGWVSGGWDSDIDGSSDGFVVKLNASGGHVWSSYLGGGSWDEGHDIAADASGNVLVTGSTESTGWISGGWLTSYAGGRDVFAVKLSAAGEHLWSTYLGGDKDDRSYGIATDTAGAALVTGYTHSVGWVSGGWDSDHSGGGDVFVVKLNAAGEHIWSTYLGGDSGDSGYDIAIDADNNALVTGFTGSSGWISGGWLTEPVGAGDGFVVKLNASGEHVWSTYLGGDAVDYAYGVAADAEGVVLVTGYTKSTGWISSGWLTNHGGVTDGFAVKLNASGGHLWSTYLGGDGDDRAHGIAIDADGNALIAGETASQGWVSDGHDATHNGFADAFVAKLTGVLTIPDPGLEQALRDATTTPSGYLRDDDLEILTTLDASSRNITSLEGLQNCVNLTELNLMGNQISDLQFLIDNAVLNDGSTVRLTGNPLSDLSFNVHIPELQAAGVIVDYIRPVIAIPDIVGRHLFYNNSVSPGGGLSGGDDDNQPAVGKAPLLPGGMPQAANYTSYYRGINGVIVDIDAMSGEPTDADFRIRVTESDGSAAWSDGPAPTVSVLPGQGQYDSDRVTLTWADGAIVNQWLEVTLLCDDEGGQLGLPENDVFLFGSAVGDCDGDGQVAKSDYKTLMSQLGRSQNGLAADLDGNGEVNLADFTIMRKSFGNDITAPLILTGDIDQSGMVDQGDLAIMIGQFGQTGGGLASDLDGDGHVGLADFAIMRSRFGSTLPPATITLEVYLDPQPAAIETTPESAAAPPPPVIDQPLDIVNVTDAKIAAMASIPTPAGLLITSQSPGDYIPEHKAISQPPGQRAATTEHDLRPLSDAPSAEDPTDDLNILSLSNGLDDILGDSSATITSNF